MNQLTKRIGQRRSRIAPPPLESRVLINKTLRFMTSSSKTYTVTSFDIINAIGMVVTVINSKITAIAQAVKIHKLEFWLNPSSGVETLDVQWLADSDNPMGGAALTNSEVSMGTARPGHMRCVPPRGCAAAMWQNSVHSGTSIDLFRIVASDAFILDLTCTWVLRDGNDGFSTSLTNITVGAAPNLGELYAPALDGAADAIAPVGRSTTT